MERLMKAGTAAIWLWEQYRMHPTISSIVRQENYPQHRDAETTKNRPNVARFNKFAKDVGNIFKEQDPKEDFNPDTCSMIFSPRPDLATYPKFGAQNLAGSTSRYNIQTAAMVVRLVHWLKSIFEFEEHEIIVTVFYSDQRSSLRTILGELWPGVNVWTVDASQGKEGHVNIIDCTTLGRAAIPPASMGFLAGSRNRFNVAISRATCGRILVGHENFAVGSHSVGPWPAMIAEARNNKWILHNVGFRAPWPANRPEIDRIFAEKRDEFLRRGGVGSASKGAIHSTALARIGSATSRPKPSKDIFRVMTMAFLSFLQACPAADRGEAEMFLIRTASMEGEQLYEAVMLWESENPGRRDNECVVEEINRADD